MQKRTQVLIGMTGGLLGVDGETKANRMMELLPDWCALQQASIMSSEVMGKNDY
jgi:hypothetical protein